MGGVYVLKFDSFLKYLYNIIVLYKYILSHNRHNDYRHYEH